VLIVKEEEPGFMPLKIKLTPNLYKTINAITIIKGQPRRSILFADGRCLQQ